MTERSYRDVPLPDSSMVHLRSTEWSFLDMFSTPNISRSLSLSTQAHSAVPVGCKSSALVRRRLLPFLLQFEDSRVEQSFSASSFRPSWIAFVLGLVASMECLLLVVCSLRLGFPAALCATSAVSVATTLVTWLLSHRQRRPRWVRLAVLSQIPCWATTLAFLIHSDGDACFSYPAILTFVSVVPLAIGTPVWQWVPWACFELCVLLQTPARCHALHWETVIVALLLQLAIFFITVSFDFQRRHALEESVALQLARTELLSFSDVIPPLLTAVPAYFASRFLNAPAEKVFDLVSMACVCVLEFPCVTTWETRYPPQRVVELVDHLTAGLRRYALRMHCELYTSLGATYYIFSGLDGSLTATTASNMGMFACGLKDAMEELHRETGVTYEVRTGIAAGWIATGLVGKSDMHFTAWGRCVEMARELARVAQPGEILTSQPFYALLGASPADRKKFVLNLMSLVQPLRPPSLQHTTSHTTLNPQTPLHATHSLTLPVGVESLQYSSVTSAEVRSFVNPHSPSRRLSEFTQNTDSNQLPTPTHDQGRLLVSEEQAGAMTLPVSSVPQSSNIPGRRPSDAWSQPDDPFDQPYAQPPEESCETSIWSVPLSPETRFGPAPRQLRDWTHSPRTPNQHLSPHTSPSPSGHGSFLLAPPLLSGMSTLGGPSTPTAKSPSDHRMVPSTPSSDVVAMHVAERDLLTDRLGILPTDTLMDTRRYRLSLHPSLATEAVKGSPAAMSPRPSTLPPLPPNKALNRKHVRFTGGNPPVPHAMQARTTIILGEDVDVEELFYHGKRARAPRVSFTPAYVSQAFCRSRGVCLKILPLFFAAHILAGVVTAVRAKNLRALLISIAVLVAATVWQTVTLRNKNQDRAILNGSFMEALALPSLLLLIPSDAASEGVAAVLLFADVVIAAYHPPLQPALGFQFLLGVTSCLFAAICVLVGKSIDPFSHLGSHADSGRLLFFGVSFGVCAFALGAVVHRKVTRTHESLFLETKFNQRDFNTLHQTLAALQRARDAFSPRPVISPQYSVITTVVAIRILDFDSWDPAKIARSAVRDRFRAPSCSQILAEAFDVLWESTDQIEVLLQAEPEMKKLGHEGPVFVAHSSLLSVGSTAQAVIPAIQFVVRVVKMLRRCEVRYRIGATTGPVFCSSMASAPHGVRYNMHGPVLDQALRFCRLVEPNTVALDAPTQSALPYDKYDTRPYVGRGRPSTGQSFTLNVLP
eukprot:TRINITY_DN17053_c0_g1_i1.p1 TRINITY_DN17053_c0_g1~~TRINITY_DN17053_c0_g1_i1.p1  ORF type:complete len:1217 (+),score=95.03 TRINITY_DN17053_c0_g1_i1:123-3773(+)